MPEKTSDKRSKLRLAFSLLAALVFVPGAIALGAAVWEGRRFYLVSLVIIAASMLPFIFKFEKRRPEARELVVLAVMIAIGVAGRAAFYMLPQFKPIVAITVITGVAFGCESGFIVGAMIAFVSNFIFGQGPWTPWQMEALGLMGFLAGLLFHRKDGRLPKLVPLVIFGVLGTILIYGVIADISTVFTAYSEISWGIVWAKLGSGFVMNLVHAGATLIFLLILARPMLKKLSRIQVKYGLLEDD